MGWPRKNDGMRIYQDKDKSYFVIYINEWARYGRYEAIANVYPGPRPSLVSTEVGRAYIAESWLKRVAWDELPEEWQKAIKEYLERGRGEGEGEFEPRNVRGFWRVEGKPGRRARERSPSS